MAKKKEYTIVNRLWGICHAHVARSMSKRKEYTGVRVDSAGNAYRRVDDLLKDEKVRADIKRTSKAVRKQIAKHKKEAQG